MFLQLLGVKSVNPDLTVPTKRNGEEMDLMSVEPSGQFLVLRYVCAEPVEGPSTEHHLVDVYCNDHGAEVFRVSAKIVQSPPPPPPFLTRLRNALHILIP